MRRAGCWRRRSGGGRGDEADGWETGSSLGDAGVERMGRRDDEGPDREGDERFKLRNMYKSAMRET